MSPDLGGFFIYKLMSTNYPTSIDDGTTLPNPSGANTLNSPDHASIHANGNDAIKAVEAKVGTGSSTPANNTFLIGNGTGTSAWSSVTSAQLASRISDETGTGSAVFATTPTLVTPKVDTINESTPANGVTVDGLNIKDGALNTNNSVVTANITDAAVTTAKIADSNVTAAKLATSAITLGYAETSSTNQTGTGTTLVAVTGCSTTVTIPAGGRRIEITGYLNAYNTTGTACQLTIYDGSTDIKGSTLAMSTVYAQGVFISHSYIPAAGSKTYSLRFCRLAGGSGDIIADNNNSKAFILVKAI